MVSKHAVSKTFQVEPTPVAICSQCLGGRGTLSQADLMPLHNLTSFQKTYDQCQTAIPADADYNIQVNLKQLSILFWASYMTLSTLISLSITWTQEDHSALVLLSSGFKISTRNIFMYSSARPSEQCLVLFSLCQLWNEWLIMPFPSESSKVGAKKKKKK
mgnify:CR=1 FL=1